MMGGEREVAEEKGGKEEEKRSQRAVADRNQKQEAETENRSQVCSREKS